jgi:type I restriction enzyme, S subunit
MKIWNRKILSDICTVFEDGDWIESKDQSSEGVRLIQTGNVGNGFFKDRGEKARYISEETFKKLRCTEIVEGDCLISRLPDPVGRACIIPDTGEKMITAVDCSIIRFQLKEILPEWFLFYTLSNEYQKEIIEQITGATRQRISRKNLGLISLPLPPLPEQQRIVSILDEAFAAISKAKANAQQNLKNTKELFESYLQGAFEDKLHGSKHESLESICELIVDCEHKTAPVQENGYPSIRTPNIGKGVLILEGVNRVSENTYNEWTRRAIPEADDLILAREAPAGNIAVIPENIKVCLGQRTVLIRPKKSKIASKYLAYLILSKDVQEQLLSHSTGATVEHINMSDIRAFKIFNLSPIKEQQAIVQKLDALSTETKKLETIYQTKINDLEELKKSILHKAFSGNLSEKTIVI